MDLIEQLRDGRYIGQEGMRLQAADEIERLRAALEGALVVIESTPRPTAGLVSNSLQAAWDKRVAAIRAALKD